jgi:4-hydroxybenzoate polyprenyltransferase
MSSIHTLASYLPFWIQVTRLDRPIGWIVLLWPTWIALTIAGHAVGEFRLDIWVIFTLGVIITRSAGCVVNDLTDRKFDKHVKRTRSRPITSGNLSVKNAVILAIVLFSVCLGLVLMTNKETIQLSFVALGFAVVYPWLKRVTFWPQIGLGLAFSMAIPMAFTAYDQPLDRIVWALFLGNVAWTLAYDTLYAMVDRDDDLLIGVKSTAIMFGRYDLLAVGYSQMGALLAFGYAFWLADLGPFTMMGILVAIGLTVRQHVIASSRSREACFRAFIESHRFGAALFFGSVLGAI